VAIEKWTFPGYINLPDLIICMRALHTPAAIVVAAVVIIVAALVILTIFGMGMAPVRTITELRSQCTIQGVSSCRATGNLPSGWNSPSVMVDGVLMSCREATYYESCPQILGREETARDYEAGESVYAGDSEGRSIAIDLPEESIDIARENLGEAYD
jgi:hypothetical protein